MRYGWCAVVLVAVSVSLHAAEIPFRTPTYTVVARALPLREALEHFAVAQGVSVMLSQQVQGVVNGDFKEMEAAAFLEQICALHHLTWYYDGSTLFFYTAHEVLNTLMELRSITAADVGAMLADLGVADTRFPIKTTGDGRLLLVNGPPRYVQLVRDLVEKADQLREQRAFCEVETRLFPITHTWADDVQLNTASPEGGNTQIKGVATLLADLIAATEVATRDRCVTNAPPSEIDRAERAFRPIIKADNRLNAVVVRDAVSRMPMYERLIRQLDVAQPLVEIGVTVLELSHEDALDWELEIRAKAARGSWSGAAGQAVSNLTAPDGLSGRGFSGAFSYIGDTFSVESSITALQEKGKARGISRSSLLTLNNMSAEITDTQSYHVRIVGDKLATLEAVSVGTQLRIKPRIVPSAVAGGEPQIWLTMELEDGGFEAMVIDSMPMSRESTLATQAAVKEGESLLLAGYLRDLQAKKTWGIPWLRDLKWIGWIFGGESQSETTVQRMFILTPRIIDLDDPEVVRHQAEHQRDLTLERQLSGDAVEDFHTADALDADVETAAEANVAAKADKQPRENEE
ncbi:MAG: type III secretion system outer membrane ring subunit SctC [Kiritimatiellae bacterium]|nr:type III secretion system outer membrane ring subunit SctC [Kiritimatiellia bacterium]